MIDNYTYLLDKVKTDYISFRLEKEILHCVFRDDLYMNLEIAKNCVTERLTFSKGKSYPCLINIEGLKAVDKEARAYMALNGTELMKAGALLTGSIYTKILGNIFLAINKPDIPTRLFSDKASAIKWLKQYL